MGNYGENPYGANAYGGLATLTGPQTWYGTSVLDGTLTTASKMAGATGGSETSKTTTLINNHVYGEIWSQGNAGLSTVDTIPATPTGRGWVFYPGAGTYATGNWSASVTLAAAGWGGTGHSPVTIRFFKFTAPSTYVSIGTLTVNATGIAKTTYAFASVSLASAVLGASDGVYVDLWWKDDNLYAVGDNPVVYESSSGTAGVASDVQITTSSFTPAGTPTARNAFGRAKVAVLNTTTRNARGRATLILAATNDVTLYGTTAASSTLATAKIALANTSGATSTGYDNVLGTATGYSEIFPTGTNAAWQALGSLPGSATGNGYLLDSTLLEGQTIPAGIWTDTIRLRVNGGTGNATASLYTRFYKRSAAGVYTAIGTLSLTGQTITNGASANYVLSGNISSSMAFSTGDKLYWERFANITVGVTGLANLRVDCSTSTTQGSVNNQAATPGYSPTSGVSVATRQVDGRVNLVVGASKTRNTKGRTRIAVSGGTGGAPGKLPGQIMSGGVSSFIFGAHDHGQPGMSVPYPPANAINEAKAINGPPMLLRTFFNNTATDAQIDSRLSVITACGGVPWICLQSPADATFNRHVVTYVGSRCQLYEFGNEPDGPNTPLSVSAFSSAWNAQIPVLRGINPDASFIGPGGTANTGVSSYYTTWLNNCKTSGVVPDGVSTHLYPCHNDGTASACLTETSQYGTTINNIRSALQSRWPSTYQNIAIGYTEWNVDWANPMVSYAKSEPFITNFIKGVMQSLINANADFSCFFSLFSGGGNYNMINDSNGSTTEFYTAYKNAVAALYVPVTYAPTPPGGHIYAVDTFIRANNASSWGTASDGFTTYTKDGGSTQAVLSIASNEGTLTNLQATWYQCIDIGSTITPTVEFLFRTTLSNAASQVGVFTHLNGGSTTTLYRIRVTGSSGDVRVERRLGGTAFALVGAAATIPAMVANTAYYMHIKNVNGHIQARVWADGATEPASWQLDVVDSSPLPAGTFGFYASSTATTDTWSFDHLTATDSGSTQMTRSVRGRIKVATTSAAQVRYLRGRMKLLVANTMVRNAKGRMRCVITHQTSVAGRVVFSYSPDMPVAVMVGTVSVPVLQTALSFEQRVDDTAGGSLVVPDPTGIYALQENQRISIVDTARSVPLFGGFIQRAEEVATNPTVDTSTVLRTFSLKDLRWLAEKRECIHDYTNWTGGNIVADVHQTILAQEGIQAQYALDHDHDIATFAEGTLTNMQATNGYLELAKAGRDVVDADSTTSDFASGTLSMVTASANALRLQKYRAIRFSAYAGGAIGINGGNYLSYWSIWKGAYTVQDNDYLEYDIWVSSQSAAIIGGVDAICSDGTTLRDTHVLDQNGGLDTHPNVELGGFADDQWYHRKIGFPAFLNTRSIRTIALAMESDKVGYYAYYVKDLHICSANGTIQVRIFDQQVPTIQRIGFMRQIGYYRPWILAVDTYAQYGTRLTTPLSLAGAGIAGQSTLSWTATIPTQPTSTTSGSGSDKPQPVLLEASLDGGDTWQVCENGKTIPSLPVGMSLVNKSLQLRQTLNIAGPNPELSPTLDSCTVAVESAYNDTDKADVSKSYAASEMTDGTNSLCGYQTAINTSDGIQRNDISGLKMNGWRKNWSTGERVNHLLYGEGSPFMGVWNGNLFLTATDTGGDVHVRFADAGTYSSLVMECNVFPPSNGNAGLLYCTTYWGNTANSFGYYVYISTTVLGLGKGANANSNAYVDLRTVSILLEADSWHQLRVVYSTSDHVHHVFLDDVEYITFTDASYSSGGVGVRMWSANGLRHGFWNDFGVSSNTALTQATRTAPSALLTPATTVGSSTIWWGQDTPGGTSVDVQTSLDGGATYTSCTSGAEIPLLSAGTSVVGKSLLVKTILKSDSVTYTPTVTGLSWLVTGAFTASGNRVSPALALTPAAIVGASSITWASDVPETGTLAVDSSLNASTWTTLNNGDSVAGLVQQGDVWWDSFAEDTSSSYAFTSGHWVWDTTSSRLVTASTSDTLLYNDLSCANVEVVLISDQLDSLQVLLRNTASGHYYLRMTDNLGSGGSQFDFVKYTASGGTTTLFTNHSLNIQRGVYHTIRMTLQDSVFNVWLDGLFIYAVTDTTPLSGSGQTGLWFNAGVSHINNFMIRQLGQSAMGLTAYDRVRMTSTDPLTSPKVTDLALCVRHPNIATGALIPATKDWAYKTTVAAALDDIAQQSNMSWRINELSQIIMQPRDGQIAPFVLATVNGNIDGATPPTITHQSPNYRNRQYVTNAIDLEEITRSKMGNGVDTSWELDYPVDTIKSIVMDTQTQTFGIREKESNKTFYYAQGEKTVTLDSSVNPPASKITFDFVAQIPYRATAEDLSQQAILAAIERASGIVEASEDGTGLYKDAADAVAQARLTENAMLALTTKLSTRQAGLSPGQLLTVLLPAHNLNDIQFLITAVSYQIKQRADGGLAYWYDLDVTTGPSIGAWARNLQTRLLLKKGGIK